MLIYFAGNLLTSCYCANPMENSVFTRIVISEPCGRHLWDPGAKPIGARLLGGLQMRKVGHGLTYFTSNMSSLLQIVWFYLQQCLTTYIFIYMYKINNLSRSLYNHIIHINNINNTSLHTARPLGRRIYVGLQIRGLHEIMHIWYSMSTLYM